MATAEARYTLRIKASLQKEGEEDTMWEDISTHKGLKYSVALGIQEVLQSGNQEILEWGKALAKALGQTLPQEDMKALTGGGKK